MVVAHLSFRDTKLEIDWSEMGYLLLRRLGYHLLQTRYLTELVMKVPSLLVKLYFWTTMSKWLRRKTSGHRARTESKFACIGICNSRPNILVRFRRDRSATRLFSRTGSLLSQETGTRIGRLGLKAARKLSIDLKPATASIVLLCRQSDKRLEVKAIAQNWWDLECFVAWRSR